MALTITIYFLVRWNFTAQLTLTIYNLYLSVRAVKPIFYKPYFFRTKKRRHRAFCLPYKAKKGMLAMEP